ncbi:M56 family metallopeptidase, partial [Nonomuraea longicatena]|uniref:M56 family metallopeptidase n=1 Tax=Nonomuraea longicatena TaxID=83682 RepID=UPI0031DE33D9
LGAVTAGLAAAVAPLAAAFPHGLHLFWHQVGDGLWLRGLGPAHRAALAWSAGLLAWLAWHAARALARTLAEQRRHRLLVDVLAERDPEHDAYLLPGEEPVAYCVPGLRARIVLSRGARARLGAAELDAVLAHERAHARGRHDLVLLPFVALAHAFPWLPAARAAREAVPVLLEMLADDRARRVHGDRVLARAIVEMVAPSPGPSSGPATPGLADTGVAWRVRRLLEHTPGHPWAPTAAYGAAAVLGGCALSLLSAPVFCGLLWPG